MSESGQFYGLCAHCGAPLTRDRSLYCSDAHRQRAGRRRRAGQPLDVHQKGARRGRVGLSAQTEKERLRAEIFAEGFEAGRRSKAWKELSSRVLNLIANLETDGVKR